MANFQRSAYEVLEQHMSSEGVELTSLTSLNSWTTNDEHVNASNQHELDTASTEALHRPVDTEHVEVANQPPPLQSSDDIQEFASLPTDFNSRTAMQKLGLQTAAILAATTILTTVVFGFLDFLWTAPRDNSFWHLIVGKGWAGGAVTVSSLMLRTAIGFQAGTAAAMLAAILLESDFRLLLADTAQVSKVRAGRATPFDIVLPSTRAIRTERTKSLIDCIQASLGLFLLATTLLLQLTSTVLVSDLSVGILPGMPSYHDLHYDFAYDCNAETTSGQRCSYPAQERVLSTWQRNPPGFPAFAEFSEALDVPANVDYTGRLIRAFLPFKDAQSRQTTTEYSGKALVLDARVSCQAPQLSKMQMRFTTSSYMVGLSGSLFYTEDVQGLDGPEDEAPFNCSIGLSKSEVETPDSQYHITICTISGRPDDGGVLRSDLRDDKQLLPIRESWRNGSMESAPPSHPTYLVSNASKHTYYNLTDDMPAYSAARRESWLDLTYLPMDSRGWYKNVSVSLCYAAYWTARLDVTMHSSTNRTEPDTVMSDGWYRTSPDVHVQMGEFNRDLKAITPKSRGILALSPKDSWLPSPGDAAQYDLMHDTLTVWTEDQVFHQSARIQAEFSSLSWAVASKISTTVEQSPY